MVSSIVIDIREMVNVLIDHIGIGGAYAFVLNIHWLLHIHCLLHIQGRGRRIQPSFGFIIRFAKVFL